MPSDMWTSTVSSNLACFSPLSICSAALQRHRPFLGDLLLLLLELVAELLAAPRRHAGLPALLLRSPPRRRRPRGAAAGGAAGAAAGAAAGGLRRPAWPWLPWPWRFFGCSAAAAGCLRPGPALSGASPDCFFAMVFVSFMQNGQRSAHRAVSRQSSAASRLLLPADRLTLRYGSVTSRPSAPCCGPCPR